MTITKPIVTPGNLNTALNTNVTDVGRLCTHANINIWAKYKPTDYNTIGETGISSGVPYWRGSDNLCGIKIKYFDQLSQLDSDNSVYALNVQAMSRYRMLDFDGYKSDSEIPFILRMPIRILVGSQQGTVVRLGILDRPQLSDYNLTLRELFGNCYFGVAVKSGGNYRVKAFSTKIQSLQSPADIELSDCGILSAGISADIYAIVTSEHTDGGWSTVMPGSAYSLNAAAGLSIKRGVPVSQWLPSTYAIGALFDDSHTVRPFTFGTVSTAGGILTCTASWRLSTAAIPTYTLQSITVNAYDLYDGTLIAKETFSLQQHDGPLTIDDVMRREGVPVTFSADTRTLDAVTGSAEYTYMFNFAST